MIKFLASVADAYIYDSNDNLTVEGKTLLDSSLEKAISSTDVTAGKGNKLLWKYYHSGMLTGALSNAQWNFETLALNAGSTITTGANIFTQETVTLTAGAGTLTGTPIAMQTSTVYAWVKVGENDTERVVATGGTFTIADTTYSGSACVTYYAYDSATRHIDLNANAVPAISRIILRTDVYSNSNSTNKIGEVIITIPKAQFDGNFTITMTPDAVSSTDVNFTALATTGSGSTCATEDVYAMIDEVIYDANWYDDVVAIAVSGGDFELADAATQQLEVWAIPSVGASFQVATADYSDLTFSGDGVTVSSAGLVTGTATGGTVSIVITEKSSVDLTVTVTVPA